MVEIKRFKKGKHIYKKWGSKFKEVSVMSEEPAQKKQQIQIQMDEDRVVLVHLELGAPIQRQPDRAARSDSVRRHVVAH